MSKQIGFGLGFLLMGPVLLAVSGCGHTIRPAEIASDAGAQAIAKYDTNKDGVLDHDELARAPGLQAAVSKIKKLASRHKEPSEAELLHAKITAEDIDGRIQEWKKRGTGRIGVACRVFRKGTPLAGAEVKFVPEDFLGPGLTTGTGTTDANGVAKVSQESRGKDDPALGMNPGFYRVEITKGTEIPAMYNTATYLGQEVAADAIGISTGGIEFDLEY